MEENGRATWKTSHRGCIMRKVISKEVTAGGRFDFSWTLLIELLELLFILVFCQYIEPFCCCIKWLSMHPRCSMVAAGSNLPTSYKAC